MIELTDLTKTYGGHTAVDRLSLRVERGEVFGFIGPNGAGKTTTIKMLGGVLEPTSGAVTVAGIDMRAAPEEAKRRIGFIPDRPYLYEKLTGPRVPEVHGRHLRPARAAFRRTGGRRCCSCSRWRTGPGS